MTYSDDDLFDPLQLESGLATEFDLTIDQATFCYDSSYKEGLCLLRLEGEALVDNEAVEFHQIYSCGPGWEPVDSGKRAAREDANDRRTFNKKSAVGTLITAASESGAGDVMRARRDPRTGAFWEGLRFHFRRMTLNQGTEYETERPLPVAFLGVVGQNGAGAAAMAGEGLDPADAPDAPVTGSPAAAGNGGGNKVAIAKLKVMAKKCDTHDDFIEAGLAVADGDPELENLVADPDWFAAAKG